MAKSVAPTPLSLLQKADVTVNPSALRLSEPHPGLKFHRYNVQSQAVAERHGVRLVPANEVTPEVLVDVQPTEAFGVAVTRMRSTAGLFARATPSDHILAFQCSGPVRAQVRLADQTLEHRPGRGSFGICPAGAESSAEIEDAFDGIVVRVATECFALAKAQLGSHIGHLIGRLTAEDDDLFRIVGTMDREASFGYPNGRLYWSSAADFLIRGLVMRHLSQQGSPPSGTLDHKALKRLDGFIRDNLAGPLDLGDLARVVGIERFHFAHRFRATVGISPHRYVMRLRLDRARELIADGAESLADVAFDTGFVDQSHLARWVRRVYNLRPTEFRN